MMIRLLFATLLIALLAGCVTTGVSDRSRQNADRDAARYNAQLAVNYMQQGRLELAKEKLDRALKQDPRNSEVHVAMAMLQQRLGEPRKADRHFRTALKLSPDDAMVANNYGVFLCQQGEYADAERYLLQAARNPLYRTPEAAYTNAGTCARRAQRMEEAEQFFRQALAADPRFADALQQLADLSLAQDDYLAARAFVQRFLAVRAATPTILWLGVQAERALGDEEAARSYAQRLRSEFPTSLEARQLLESERNAG